LKVPCAVAGGDGESHWEERELALEAADPAEHGIGGFAARALGSWDAAIVEFPPDFAGDFHADGRSIAVMIAGRIRFELSDGTSVTLGPGEVAMFEDAAGGGHRPVVLDGKGATLLSLNA